MPTARPHNSVFVVNASLIVRAHTCLALAAFSSALVLGLLLHYTKIVKNGVAGYPQEWFPSVSATIGDWSPERNVFQILIALTSGPRMALIAFQYLIQRTNRPTLASVTFVFGLIRTLSCGGWVYVTSTDNHDFHDVAMILYIVCNIPWMLGGIACTTDRGLKKHRIIVAACFFGSIIPLVYFFIQHKLYRIPGAYTRYAFFEWALIFFDVWFDSLSEEDFRGAGLQVSVGHVVLQTSASTPSIPVPEKQPVKSAGNPAPQTPSSLYMMLSGGSFVSREAVSFVSDVYLSYVFWSVFTSLIPTLFYFSVWELGIAGSELALLSTLSPIFLGSASVLNWTQTTPGQTVLHALSFLGIAAYVLDKPLHRLFVVSLATSSAMLRQVVEWNDDPTAYQSIVTSLGLLVSSLSKHANHSNNPVWPIVNNKSGGYNKTGLAFALLSLMEFLTRSARAEHRATISKPTSSTKESWFMGAIALGSLLFTFHNHLSDSSILIAWSWTGYQNGAPRGPMPHLHGSLTLIAQTLGLVVALNAPDRTLTHPLWFAYGTSSAYIMYAYRNWLGYLGGLNFCVFTMALVPSVFRRATTGTHMGKSYFAAVVVYCILSLASVWTVAYAFVPGGVFLRERTDLVTIAQLVCLGFAFDWPLAVARPAVPRALTRNVRSYTKTTLAMLCLAGVLVTLYRQPAHSLVPHRQGPRLLRVGIWTLHFGIDNAGRDSQRRVRDLIRDMELDVVGLLETDLYRTVYGNRDLTRVLTEDLGYYVDLGPGPNQHTWGAVLLSKFPIINSTHHLLPSPDGELAPAIEAELDVYGTIVTVVVAHNGQEETPIDREVQSIELAAIMSASPHPVIFLGYVVTKPHAKRPSPYQILIEDGRMHDIDEDDHDRWCEYILYRGLYRTAYARVSRDTITDTELQIGQFVVPQYGTSVINDTREARYLRAYKSWLPEEHWLPPKYYGEGVNGHSYHVFGTPLYYKLPDEAFVLNNA